MSTPSWAVANARTSGEVSTPPKSEISARSSGTTDQVVVADAAAAVHVPGEERAVEPQLAEVERRAAQDLAGRAAGVAVLLAHPQRQAGPALAPVAVVRGGDARIVDVQAAGRVEQHAPGGVGAVA